MGLPGDIEKLKVRSQVCDKHPRVFASYRLTGETDSMGSEYHYLCTTCYDQHQKREAAGLNKTIADCDWCDATNVELRPQRDFEEGNNGPVYYVCGACSSRQAELLSSLYDDED